MALLFKSNVPPATGGPSLPTIEQVAYTASQLYDIYEARVVADGGEIIDAAATLAAIEHAQDNGLYGRMAVAVSPSWGVKKTSSRYDKMYGLEGEDLEGVALGGGDKPLASTDSNGFAVAVCDVNASRVGGIMQSVNSFIPAAVTTEPWAIVTCQNDVDGLTMQTAFGNVATAGTGFVCAVLGRTPAAGTNQTNGAAQISTYDPAAASDASKLLSPSGSRGATDALGTAIAMQISTGIVTLYSDGSLIDTETSGTGALYNYTGLSRKLYVGSQYSASANITPSRKGYMRDTYVLKRASLVEIAALTRALTLRYAA